MYADKKKIFGNEAYLHLSEIFDEAREKYKQEYLRSPRALKLKRQGKVPDAEQSWKPFKGKNFEKLVWYMLDDQLRAIGLRCIPGEWLEKSHLSAEQGDVYRKLLVRYGKWSILPDADLVIYDPSTRNIFGIISCKITLRERVAQTAYWKLKLASDPLTMHIKGYFITADEDGDLIRSLSENPSRNRIIVENELDGTYVFRKVSESERVKAFPRFMEDVKRLTSR